MLDFGFGLLTLEFGPWTLDCLLPTADCRLTTLNKLLRFVQPTLVRAILVGWRSLHSFNAGLHRTRGFTPVAKSGMRASHQVKPFRIGRPLLEKLFERIARVFILFGGNVSRTYLAPNFVLAVRSIARHHLFEILDSIGKTL